MLLVLLSIEIKIDPASISEDKNYMRLLLLLVSNSDSFLVWSVEIILFPARWADMLQGDQPWVYRLLFCDFSVKSL